MKSWLSLSVALLTLLGALGMGKSELQGGKSPFWGDSKPSRTGAVLLLFALVLQVSLILLPTTYADLEPMPWYIAVSSLLWLAAPRLVSRIVPNEKSKTEAWIQRAIELILGK